MSKKFRFQQAEMLVAIFSLLLATMLSCKKFIAVDVPPGVLGDQAVFATESNATAALLDVYPTLNMTFGQGGFSHCVTNINGIYSDDYTLTVTAPDAVELYTNSLSAVNANVRTTWSRHFQAIYKLNAFEEGLRKYGENIPKSTADQLIGEARFLRAFCYFNLVNIFGEVPILLTADYNKNNTASRNSVTEVYVQITKDLQEAEALISENYLNDDNTPGTLRIRPNKDAVRFLLSRVCLYQGRWADAIRYASSIIDKGSTFSLGANLTLLYDTDSREAIFQVPANFSSTFPQLANTYVLNGPPSTAQGELNMGTLSSNLLGSFEPGDKRSSSDWVGLFSSFFISKV